VNLRLPLTLEQAGIAEVITSRLGMRRTAKPDMSAWKRMVKCALTNYKRTVRVGVIAKYVDNHDTYMSVFEAIRAAGWANEVNVEIIWVKAEALEKDQKERQILDTLDAIIVPGGFGERGLEGKILAATYALDKKMPYLGICLGLQMAVIAAARRAGFKEATSIEMDPNSPHKVIDYMADQADKKNTGGTMRLGDYPTVLARGTKARKAFGQENIIDRHRHRCECSNDYRDKYESWGITASGLSPDGHLVEVIEALDHPYFLATQAHPELRSRPNRPHPLFMGLIRAVLAKP
jgi:CTP synthase